MKKIILAFLVIVLVACTSKSDNEQKAIPTLTIDIPLTQSGEIISVDAPKGWNSYKLNDPVTLMLEFTGISEVLYDRSNSNSGSCA